MMAAMMLTFDPISRRHVCCLQSLAYRPVFTTSLTFPHSQEIWLSRGRIHCPFTSRTPTTCRRSEPAPASSISLALHTCIYTTHPHSMK